MSNAYIIGSGMIRFNKCPDKTVKGMAEEAIDLALADAGVSRKDLQAAFFLIPSGACSTWTSPSVRR